ncbi:apoptotic protease-activating factor 1 [Diachasma alloeum]|uniref:apoptotic protease-activating factor 1 n=1 Tax=Diachasma alloeum TaxID=454923 RepID=UPI0007384FEE|nr:apoptotic protease-activating factor 1 [Diachasma alloeum]
MEQVHRNILINLRETIVQDLDVTNGVIDHLTKYNILKPEDIVEISSRTTAIEKARRLLDILPNRGPGAFSTFQKALEHHYPWLSKAMSKSLVSTGTDAVDSTDARNPILPPISSLTVIRQHKMNQLQTALSEVKPGGYVVIHGMKGFGRSHLAVSVLNKEMMHKFDNEIYWIKFGFKGEASQPTDCLEDEILKQLNKLYHQVINDPYALANDNNTGFGKHHLGKFLKNYFSTDHHRNALLVLDDVWDNAIIETFDFNCKTLVITTDIDLLGKRHKEVVDLNKGFTELESLDLFAQVLNVEINELPQQAKDIHHACNGIPILIHLVAAQFSDFREAMTGDSKQEFWNYYLDCLRKKDSKFFDMQEAIFDMCINRLPESAQTRYKNLAIFSEDVNISSKTLEILWDTTIPNADKWMKDLCNKSLVGRQWNQHLETYIYGVHDLLLDHLRKKLAPKQLLDMHKDFINKYDKSCNGDFSKLPKDNYSFSYIGHHLEQAEMAGKFPVLYLDFNFICAKICNSGINDLLIDLKKYRKYITQDTLEREAKVVDVEKFVKAQVKILVEHRRRDCLNLVQIGMNYDIRGYVHETAKRLAEFQPMHLYLSHEQQYRREESPNGDEVPIELTTVNFTNNPNHILLGSNHGVVILWDMKNRRQFPFYGHEKKSKILKVIVSERGDFFVALNDQGVVKRFSLDAESDDDNSSDEGSHVHTPREKQISYSYIHKIPEDQSCTTYSLNDLYITDIALSPDDKRLAACGKKGYFRVWEINGTILSTGQVDERATDRLAFAHNIPLLFFVDAEEGVIVVYSPGNNYKYNYLSTYRPGRNTGEVWKGLKGKKAIYFNEIKTDPSCSIQMLLVTNLETICVRWNCTDQGQLSNPSTQINIRIDPELNPDTEFTAATLTHQDQYIVIADSKGFIRVYEDYNNINPKAEYSGKAISLDSYYIANDSHSIIAGFNHLTYKWSFQCESNLPQSVRIPKFDALMKPLEQPDIVVQVMGKKIRVFKGHDAIAETDSDGDIIDLSVCQDGERIMYVEKKGHLEAFAYEIRIFNYQTNQAKSIHSLNRYRGPIKFLQVNGSHVPVWKNGDNLKIAVQSNVWAEAVATGNVINLHTIEDTYVVTVSDTGKIIIWKVFDANWDNICELPGSQCPNVCFSVLNSQENMLTLLKTTGEMTIYNIERERTRDTVRMVIRKRISNNYPNRLTCCSFSPDGKFLAVGMADGLISIYDVELDRIYVELSLHCNPVLQFHWAPEAIGAPILLSVNCDDMAWWNIALTQDEKKMNRRSRTGVPKSLTTPTFGMSPRGSMRISASQSAAAISEVAKRLENSGIGERNESDEEKTRQFWASKVAKYNNKPGLLGLVQLPHSCQPKVCVSNDFKKFLLVDVHGSTNTYKLFGL